MSQLRVITGHSIGTAFPIPEGASTIGRDTDAGVRLADAQISRRHATLERSGDRTILSDLGSTNGTSVNGRALHGSQELRNGDVIRIGPIELVYEMNESGPGGPIEDRPAGGPAPAGRVRMGRVILLAAVVQVIGWLVAVAVTFLAGTAVGVPGWLLAPTVAVAAGIAQAIFEAVTGPDPGRARDTRTRPARRRGVPAVVAIVAVLIIGAAGYGATVGIRYGVGWLTGNEDQVGAQRVIAAQSGTSGRVTVTVTSIVNTRHFTRVELTVDNQEDKPATLALFHNCVLTGGGVTLQPDPFKSDWPEEVPPRSTQQGRVIFTGHLPDGATTAQLSFLRVFVFGRFGVDDSVVIRSIRLRPP